MREAKASAHPSGRWRRVRRAATSARRELAAARRAAELDERTAAKEMALELDAAARTRALRARRADAPALARRGWAAREREAAATRACGSVGRAYDSRALLKEAHGAARNATVALAVIRGECGVRHRP